VGESLPVQCWDFQINRVSSDKAAIGDEGVQTLVRGVIKEETQCMDLYSDSLMAIFFFLPWFFTMVELSKAVIAHNERLSVTLLPPWTAFVRANGQAGSYNIASIVSQCENLLVVLWICGDHVHNLTDLANNLGQVPTQGFVGAWVILDINGCFNGWAFMTWRMG